MSGEVEAWVKRYKLVLDRIQILGGPGIIWFKDDLII